MEPYQHTSNFDLTGWAGWIVRSDRGRLRLTGAGAVEFLQALVTNDIASLPAGESRDAAYLTPQGRMISDMRVFRGRRDGSRYERDGSRYERDGSRLERDGSRLERDGSRLDDEVLVSVPAELAASLAARLDSLIFADDVQVSDVSGLIHEITLVGETMARTRDMFVAAGREAALRDELMSAGLPELDAADAEAMRIDAGIARWGVDMNEDTIPLEAGLLDRAISQTKGCYVGQEVIIRVLHRGGGRVAKRLMKIAFAPEVTEPPAAGSPITIDGKDAGRITSATWSERRSRVLALGYVHRDHANEGTPVIVGSAAGMIGAAAS